MTTEWTQAERDRVRERVDALFSRLPDVSITDKNGHVSYSVRAKRFSWLLVDHHNDGRLGLCLKAPPGEQQALVAADSVRYFVPSYLGANGWVGVALDGDSDPDWDEVAGLIDQAWRMTASRRAIAAFDADQEG